MDIDQPSTSGIQATNSVIQPSNEVINLSTISTSGIETSPINSDGITTFKPI